jgi:hypothetical protein
MDSKIIDLLQEKVGEYYIAKNISQMKNDLDAQEDFKELIQCVNKSYFSHHLIFPQLKEWEIELLLSSEKFDETDVLYFLLSLSESSDNISTDFIKKYDFSDGINWYLLFEYRKTDDLKNEFPEKYQNFLIMKQYFDDLVNEGIGEDILQEEITNYDEFIKLDKVYNFLQ